MEFCTSCGHQLGVGRFCTNCGHPIDAPVPTYDDDTAERRPAVPPPPAGPPPAGPPPAGPPPSAPPPVSPPPTAHPGPPAARYPLFADEAATSPAPPPAAFPLPPSPVLPDAPHGHRGSGGSWLPWLLAAVLALVLFATIGLVLLRGDGDDGEQPTATDSTRSSTHEASATPTQPSSPPPSTTSDSASPSGEPEDVARLATVEVPATAPPNQDVDGNQVRYEGRNMLDGVPETCWRMQGDGTGSEITITLAEPTTITSVGLINGYAKTATGAGGSTLDWYRGNRRVLAVEWSFDDGTVIEQELGETRDLQSVDVGSVTTSTVRIRLLQVSKPGRGPAARNYTPISDVAIVGTPG